VVAKNAGNIDGATNEVPKHKHAKIPKGPTREERETGITIPMCPFVHGAKFAWKLKEMRQRIVGRKKTSLRAPFRSSKGTMQRWDEKMRRRK
jgi:hypothetical protein